MRNTISHLLARLLNSGAAPPRIPAPTRKYRERDGRHRAITPAPRALASATVTRSAADRPCWRLPVIFHADVAGGPAQVLGKAKLQQG